MSLLVFLDRVFSFFALERKSENCLVLSNESKSHNTTLIPEFGLQNRTIRSSEQNHRLILSFENVSQLRFGIARI